MADPEVHVVTVTVTEKGYGFDSVTRRLDPAHPAIAPDLADPRHPRGLVGALVEGLRLRRQAGLGGLSILSCDNLTGNGHLLADLVVDFAGRTDPGLAEWIATTCSFPDSMVDRITPASTPETMAYVQTVTGRDDPLAVETEPFRQWVIEDSFVGPRPDWQTAGALLVADVAPYEVMKLRMLNGSHSLIAYLGAVAGFEAVRDVMAVPALRAVVQTHIHAAAATLPSMPGFDPARYAADLITRFENPAIRHLCLQIATDGSQKMPQRIFAAAADALALGQNGASFARATAIWLRFLQGRSDTDKVLVPNDPLAETLMLAAISGAGDPMAVVTEVARCLQAFGKAPFTSPEWRMRVAADLGSLRDIGVLGTCAALT